MGAYGSCRSCGKRKQRVSHSSLDGANSAPPTGSTGPATGCRERQEGGRDPIAAAELAPAAGLGLGLGLSDICSADRFEGKYPCKRLAGGTTAGPDNPAIPPRRIERRRGLEGPDGWMVPLPRGKPADGFMAEAEPKLSPTPARVLP
jgi:hypothetical protein